MTRKCKLDMPIDKRNTGWNNVVKPVYCLPLLMRAMKEKVPVTLEGRTGIIESIIAEDGSGRSWIVTLKQHVSGVLFWKRYTSENLWIYAVAQNSA